MLKILQLNNMPLLMEQLSKYCNHKNPLLKLFVKNSHRFYILSFLEEFYVPWCIFEGYVLLHCLLFVTMALCNINHKKQPRFSYLHAYRLKPQGQIKKNDLNPTTKRENHKQIGIFGSYTSFTVAKSTQKRVHGELSAFRPPLRSINHKECKPPTTFFT